MVEYSKVNVKLTDKQLKKLKTFVKNETGTTLRMSLKMFNGIYLPHELLQQFMWQKTDENWQQDKKQN